MKGSGAPLSTFRAFKASSGVSLCPRGQSGSARTCRNPHGGNSLNKSSHPVKNLCWATGGKGSASWRSPSSRAGTWSETCVGIAAVHAMAPECLDMLVDLPWRPGWRDSGGCRSAREYAWCSIGRIRWLIRRPCHGSPCSNCDPSSIFAQDFSHGRTTDYVFANAESFS